jgi:hypothetical protein
MLYTFLQLSKASIDFTFLLQTDQNVLLHIQNVMDIQLAFVALRERHTVVMSGLLLCRSDLDYVILLYFDDVMLFHICFNTFDEIFIL